jgi:endonuclease YncB( thermonuclease family)
MVFTRSAASRIRGEDPRPWRSRPSLSWSGTRSIGLGPLLLAVVLAGALALHAGQRAHHRGSPAAFQGDFRADIVGKAWVIDGDTIDISGTRIRLLGIDAPESNQTCTDAGNSSWLCGRTATHALIDHLAGRPLQCESRGRDRYRRVLALCQLPDGSDINAWMVQQGWALAYFSSAYRSQEAEAHAAKRGIWAASFVPPWVWRHRHFN